MIHFLTIFLATVVDPTLRPESPPADSLKRLETVIEKVQREGNLQQREEYIESHRFDVPKETGLKLDDKQKDTDKE